MILSYSEKKARIINLDSNFVLIKGANHVGKSCVVKSLYRALGAEIKKMPDSWDMSTIVLLLWFTIDSVKFKSLLIGNDLFILNPDGSIRLKNKVGSNALSKNINSLLGVNLTIAEDSEQNIPVGANYMPFYIDQDAGWADTWCSFSKVGTLSDKSNIRQYLTGIVDDEYFTCKKKLSAVEKEIKKDIAELRSYKLISTHVRTKLQPLKVEVDVRRYQERINSYLEKLKHLREEQNRHLRLLQDLYSKKTYIELNIEQLKKNIKDIEKDFRYALDLDDVITCPTCGAVYTNDISDQHEFMSDVHDCCDIVIRLTRDLDNVKKQIETASEKSKTISSAIEDTQNLIKESNDEISLDEVIESRSREHMQNLVSSQCTELADKLKSLQIQKCEFEKIVKSYEDSGRKTEAEKIFTDDVLAAVKFMGSSAKRKKSRFGGRITATGSDLPISVIAHTFSYLRLVNRFSGPVFMPVVIDEPKQQGLNQKGLKKSIEYMLKAIPPNGQLILALADDKDIDTPNNSIILDLNKSERLLVEEDFTEVRNEVDKILEKDFLRNWTTNDEE